MQRGHPEKRKKLQDGPEGHYENRQPIDLDFDVLGYIDPGITINIIENDGIVAKRALQLPERLTNVIRCKNPRCITSTEQELDHVFKLTDRENRIYRCIYCEAKAKKEG